MNNLQQRIQNLFKATHPEIGNHSRCATGEPYVTYGIAGKDKEVIVEMLLNTFRTLAYGCAPMIPQGCPMCYDDNKPRYLYWRLTPILDIDEPDSGVPAGYWTIRCRAVVSDRWVEEGQVL